MEQRLETFLKVVACGSYTAAAQALHITQPAVTQHIRKLEEQYGSQLIDFSGHQMHLTTAGELLHHYATLQAGNERQLRKALESQRRTIRLGATLSIADYYLPELLRPYLRERAGELSLRVGNTRETLAACHAGELDCAFIEGIFDTEGFVTETVRLARFLPVVAANHPLAGAPRRLEELFSHGLLLREPGSGTRTILENCLYERNLSPGVFATVMECGSFRMIKEIIRETQAVSFMYEAVAREEVARGELAFLTLSDCAIRRPLRFAYPKYSMSAGLCREFFTTYIAPVPDGEEKG